MTTRILIVGCHADILATVLRLVNANPSRVGVGASSASEALERVAAESFDLVLLTNGLSESEEASLRADVAALRPALPVVQHYGGGSGLLDNEIRAALELGRVVL